MMDTSPVKVLATAATTAVETSMRNPVFLRRFCLSLSTLFFGWLLSIAILGLHSFVDSRRAPPPPINFHLPRAHNASRDEGGFDFATCPETILTLERSDGGVDLVKDEACAIFEGLWVTAYEGRRLLNQNTDTNVGDDNHHKDDNDHSDLITWEGNPPTLWQALGRFIVAPTDNLLSDNRPEIVDIVSAAARAAQSDLHPNQYRASFFMRASKLLQHTPWRVEYQTVFTQSLWLAQEGNHEAARQEVGKICGWWE